MSFLLGTWPGHFLIGLFCVCTASGIALWRGHSWGWSSATAHYSAVVTALQNANAGNLQTVSGLQDANLKFSEAATVSAARLAAAVQRADTDKAQDAKALAAAQAKLHEAEASHGDARAWSVTKVPPSILDAIGEAK